MKIRYISFSEKNGLYDDFQRIYEEVLEVESTTHFGLKGYYLILDTPFNRDLFFRVGADATFLIGKRINGKRCVIIREYAHNKAALELLKKGE